MTMRLPVLVCGLPAALFCSLAQAETARDGRHDFDALRHYAG
jgi:hypothetical protein